MPNHQSKNLSKARDVSHDRCELKKQIWDGDVRVADILLNPPDCVLTMSIFKLLSAQNRWGLIRCQKFMTKVEGPWEINMYKRIENTTERERRVISECLNRR